MTATAAWVDGMSRSRVVDVAIALGLHEQGRSPSSWCLAPCPACGAERRHTRSEPRGDRGRGPIGVARATPNGWRCHQCDASGSTIDLVAYSLRGSRYRDLHDSARAEVREWCCGWLRIEPGTPYTPPARRATPAAEPPPSYPSIAQVADLWDHCTRVDVDADVREYLLSRALAPGLIAELDLARALPTSGPALPEWARRWLSSGHRLIVPMYDAMADMRSVLARSIDRSAARKSLAPSGYQRAGLSMQCPFVRYLVRTAGVPEWWPAHTTLRVIVAEGEIDYLTVATEWTDSAECAPALIGITSGSWTAELAARIPDRATVLIATHLDPQGERYASAIVDTLAARPSVRLERWSPAP